MTAAYTSNIMTGEDVEILLEVLGVPDMHPNEEVYVRVGCSGHKPRGTGAMTYTSGYAGWGWYVWATAEQWREKFPNLKYKAMT